MSVARAEELFDQLARQVWLVEQGSGARELIHRADLRRLMLPAILAERKQEPWRWPQLLGMSAFRHPIPQRNSTRFIIV
ncbi:hypothetical protein AB664_26190 [Brucella anthropi]|uniref:Uncharacterized protein n=1 Tax=Brucella anthropi TaxID=529 RepID=A0A656Z8V1_BRUAN|nr:hypothetical protein AB664_26190 [Brucella anthropi]